MSEDLQGALSFLYNNPVPLLFLLSLAFFLALTCVIPPFFVFDEGIYALMIKEFSANPSMVLPTVTGVHAEWKPPLFTWVYSSFYFFLKYLPVDTEIIMRLPSALFASGAVVFLFLIAEKLYDRRTALVAAVLFATSSLVMSMFSLMMMEAFSLFLLLGAIYFYISDRIMVGALLLGMLTLTKWLYALVPILFLILFFWRKPKLKEVVLSFAVVPAALVLYLLLAYFFSDAALALNMLFFDILRGTPGLDLERISRMLFMVGGLNFPIFILFFYFIFQSRRTFLEEVPVIAWALLLVPLAFSKLLLFWYFLICFPPIIMFVSKRIADEKTIIFWIILFGLVCLNLFSSVIVLNAIFDPNDVKEMSYFLKGKNTVFYEPNPLYLVWSSVNQLYGSTNKSYLLLEQTNPGFLFYRFSDEADTYNLRPVFSEEGIICAQGQYLAVHRQDINAFPEKLIEVNLPTNLIYLNSTSSGFYDVYICK